jgi:hypothetical protein
MEFRTRTITRRKACLQEDNDTLKTCYICKHTKPLSQFYRHRGMKDGYYPACADCQRNDARQYYRDNKERLKAKTNANYYANKDRRSVLGKKNRDRVRDEAFAHYGGYVCSCCGETEKMFLTLDHIYNDGRWHRRAQKIKSGSATYYWLRRNEWPSNFAVLCWNCNVGKHRNNGVCPHKEEVDKAA